MIIVYSTTRVPAELRPEGARYLNAGFFTGCEPGASLVYLNGDFPKVRAAYERAGVPVADLRSRTAPVAALGAPEGKVGDHNVAPVDTLPALADLPEAEQAEVEAVLNDDAPFDGLADDAELMRLMDGTGLRSVTEPDAS